MILSNYSKPGKNLFPVLLTFSFLLISQIMCIAQYRPSLLFREDWKETPPAIPIDQEHVTYKGLILNLYGTGRDSLKKSHHDHPSDDPYYLWSGLCKGNWAVTLRHKDLLLDLSEYAKIKWRTKQSGFRNLHLILKLADGTWLVSNQYDDHSKDWRIHEFNIMDIQWYSFNIEYIYEGKLIGNPDLSKIDEIGFTDLMPGGMSDACSRVDWIEVYGKSHKRNSE